MDPSIQTADGQLLAIIRRDLQKTERNPKCPSWWRKTVKNTLLPALDRAIQLTEMNNTIILPRADSDMLTAALAKHNILQAVEHLPFISAEGGYQFVAGPEIEGDEIIDEFNFVNEDGKPWPEDTILGLLSEGGPWFREMPEQECYEEPYDDGPTDQQIEDEMIERDIERWEEDLRGENGPVAQAKAEAQARHNEMAMQIALNRADQVRRLKLVCGSPALAKAIEDEFDYALRLRSGEVIRFSRATLHEHGWVTLHGMIKGGMRTDSGLPYPADRGLDVRLEEILWVMDAPCGS